MTSILAALGVVIVVGVIWRYLSAQPYGKGKDRRELADALLFLLRLMENGGKLHARAVDHKVALCFERVSGDDSRAVVSLEVEGEMKPQAAFALDEVFQHSHTSESEVVANAPDSVLARWQILDIWDDGCVAPIVQRSWRVLDALDMPPAARIDFSLDGPRSGRWARRLRNEH